ncbi:MAG: spore coat polysaccharide biosynthesis predicted glycosyltransferase SpsG, partial [Polaribacter sp.]
MSNQSVLIIGAVWVEPNSSAAGSRMLQLIELLLQQNYAITFATTTQKTDKAFDLKSIGIDEVSIKLNSVSFDAFVKELNPTIVVFDRFMIEEQFGWRVVENCPNAIRILDTEDLHCLRKVREEFIKKQEAFTIDKLLTSDIAKREIA